MRDRAETLKSAREEKRKNVSTVEIFAMRPKPTKTKKKSDFFKLFFLVLTYFTKWVLLQSFEVFHGINNYHPPPSPFKIQLFVPWKTGKVKKNSGGPYAYS